MIWNIVAAGAFLTLMLGAPLVVLQLDKPDALQAFSEALTLETSRDIDTRQDEKKDQHGT